MGKLLYVQASPRGERSKSIAVADAFVDAYRRENPGDEIQTLDLFKADLPAFDRLAAEGKYAILHGREHTRRQKQAWKAVGAVIDEFRSAEKYVFAVPMWNFGVPYRLKHYIDLLVQPGYTFSYTPEEGYKGLLTGKRAFVAYARGGEYVSEQMQAMDFQQRYFEMILAFVGIVDVRSIVLEPTLMAGPDIAADKLQDAVEQARRLVSGF